MPSVTDHKPDHTPGKRPEESVAGSGRAKPVRRRRGAMQRMRRWLLGGTVALLLLLAGFIGYARHRARKALLDLPRLLGADIRSEANNVSWSQTVKGRTLFTIRAAKEIQRQDGKTTLHDVSVTLYGPPGSSRVDSIRGAEFEYDQPNGVVRAIGETTLDLASPAAGSAAKPNAERVTVTAKGLIFMQKLGVAATDDLVHFQYGTTKGEARGADYDADTGMLRLRQDVHLVSEENGHVEKVDAGSAEIDRNSRVAVLHRSTVTDATDVIHAQTLTVQLRPQGDANAGSLQQVRGQDGVEIVTDGDSHVTAPSFEAEMNAKNRPTMAFLHGGVQIHSSQGDGVSGEARIGFDGAGHANHVSLLHAVRLDSEGEITGSTRKLNADRVKASLTSDGGKHTVLQQAVATGDAKLTIFDPASATSKGPTTTVVQAATLHAFGNVVDRIWRLSRVEGEGATSLDERDATGVQRTSTGDHMTATMSAGSSIRRPNGANLGGHSGVALIHTLIQQGHVRIVEDRPAVAAAGGKAARSAGKSQGTADRAEYDADTGRLLLTGSPEVSDTGVQIAAEHISLARETGDAEAQGSVKGSYLSSPANASARGSNDKAVAGAADAGSRLLHFIADRAVLNRAENTASLYGGARPVRLWNGSAQLDAPVIDLDRATGRLYAHDMQGSSSAASVRTVLPGDSASAVKSGPAIKSADTHVASSAPQTPVRTKNPVASSGGSIRIASRDLVYLQGVGGAPGRAEFHGGVRLDENDGQIVSDVATAFLRPNQSHQSAPLMGDAVERIVAQGHVRFQQPGRTATGDRLVYTTAEQKFEMTGAGGVLPVVRDSVQGTVTGASLIFHAGDDSVEVVGANGRPVRTETPVPARKAAGRATQP